MSITFAEQPRCLRVAWALEHLFNAKTGFCNASNTYLASETALTSRNVQKALAALETDGAIVRSVTVQTGAQRWRAIYPATSILAVGVTSTVDVGGHVHQVDVQNSEKKTPHAEDAARARPARGRPPAGRRRITRGARESCPSASSTDPSPNHRASRGTHTEEWPRSESERRH